MQPNYKRIFQKKHVLLPVIYVQDVSQTRRNVQIAQENGADGCLLINHGSVGTRLLGDIYTEVQKFYPNFWTGVNLFGLTARDAMRAVPSDLPGLWTDNAGIDSDTGTVVAAHNNTVRSSLGAEYLYFGGVAFKPETDSNDEYLAQVAKSSIRYVDVVTTSGPEDSGALKVEKIQIMRKAIGDHPLAIASGITPENVHMFMPYADCFLVAKGISKTFTELDPDKVRQLADILHG